MRGQGKRLPDYHLVNGSTITVCMRVKGGAGRLEPLPGKISITFDEPDMISLVNSGPSAKMPCGHVIS